MKNKKNKRSENGSKGTSLLQYIKVQRSVIKELFSKYRWDSFLIVFLSFITLATQVVELFFLQYVTNSVAYLSDAFPKVLKNISIFIAALLLLLLTNNCYRIISQKYQSKIVFESEKKLILKLSHIPYDHYESNAFYEKVSLARQASGQYANAIYGITQLVNLIGMIVAYSIMLSKVSFLYIIAILGSMCVCALIAGRTTKKQLDYWRTHVSPISRKNGYFKGIFGNRINHANIQCTNSFRFFCNQYGAWNKQERKSILKLNAFSFVTELVSSLLFLVVYFITTLTIGKGVVSGYFTIGYFTMITAMVASLFSSIKSFTLFILDGNWYVKVLEAFYEILNTKECPAKAQECLSASIIEINDLRYTYPQSESAALNGVSIRFRPGEKLAVVGYNGSGKTTFISAILGLLSHYEGTIGTNACKITAVLQDFRQYQMTIKENIEIGCGGRSLPEETVVRILKQVRIYDFVEQLPDGIYTQLGQLNKGTELSKGQWQKLAIGRLLANEEANVWILDEPTAYLDPLAEIELYHFILELSGDRLVFFISHRLGFAKRMDQIIVFENGKIAELGSHAELYAKPDGLYAKMFRAQEEWYRH